MSFLFHDYLHQHFAQRPAMAVRADVAVPHQIVQVLHQVGQYGIQYRYIASPVYLYWNAVLDYRYSTYTVPVSCES